MRFSVIYEVNAPKGTNLRPYVPPKCKQLWECTEEVPDEPGEIHRKWVALLSEDDFDSFVAHVQLHAEDVRTMGSLGAPGFDMGWAPAYSFNGEDNWRVYQNAYVTPYPDSAEELEAWLRKNIKEFGPDDVKEEEFAWFRMDPNEPCLPGMEEEVKARFNRATDRADDLIRSVLCYRW